MSSTEEANKMVVLKSIDGLNFEVEESVVVQFESIKHMFQDNLAGAFIPLPNIKSEILTKVIEYCKRHAKDTTDEVADEEDLKAFDADFVNVEHNVLFDMILAANYLNIRSLLDLTCQTVADMIKGKTAEEIANFFNIRVENTPEEQVETRRETAWAFE